MICEEATSCAKWSVWCKTVVYVSCKEFYLGETVNSRSGREWMNRQEALVALRGTEQSIFEATDSETHAWATFAIANFYPSQKYGNSGGKKIQERASNKTLGATE